MPPKKVTKIPAKKETIKKVKKAPKKRASAKRAVPAKSKVKEIQKTDVLTDPITVGIQNKRPVSFMEDAGDVVPHKDIPDKVKASIIDTYGDKFFKDSTWTKGQLIRLGRAISHPRENVTSTIAQICGPNCTMQDICPYSIANKEPIGDRCISGDALISLTDGSIKVLSELSVGDFIHTFNTETNKIEEGVVENIVCNGIRDTVEILTLHGFTLQCTYDHPFWTVIGKVHRRLTISKKNEKSIEVKDLPHMWKSVDDGLSISSKIAIPNRLETSGSIELPEGVPQILGYFLGDGDSGAYTIHFTNNNKNYIDEFVSLCELNSVQCNVMYYESTTDTFNGYTFTRKEYWVVTVRTKRKGSVNPIRDIIRKWGLMGVTGPNKLLPNEVFSLRNDQLCSLINRFWSADGSVHPSKDGKVKISNTQENKDLLRQFQFIFMRFGIQSHIYPEMGETKMNWRLVIADKTSVLNFFDHIGLIYGKEENSLKCIEHATSTSDKFTHIEEDIRWDYIKEITPRAPTQVYDITVSKNSNFFANGILVHNCPIEINVASRIYESYVEAVSERLKIEPTEIKSDIILHNLVNGIVEADMVEARLNGAIAEGGFTTDVPVVVNEQTGEVFTKEEESIAVKIKERIAKRKDQLFRQLLATPEMAEKYKRKGHDDNLARSAKILDKLEKIVGLSGVKKIKDM